MDIKIKVKKIYELINLLESESDDDTKELHNKISEIKDKWDKAHKKLIKEKNKKIKEIKQKALNKIKDLDDPFELKKVKGDAEDIIDRIIEDYKTKTKKNVIMRNKEIDITILQKNLKKSALVGAASLGVAYGGYKYYNYLQKRKEAEKKLGENYMPKLYEDYLTELKSIVKEQIARAITRKVPGIANPLAQRATALAQNAVKKSTAYNTLAAKVAALQKSGAAISPEMAKELAALRDANIQAQAAKANINRGM